MDAAVRERLRDASRAELANVVFDIVAAGGLELTVEEIAHRAGISRATFFRYFGSKEDAVVAAVQSSHTDFDTALRAIDPRPGETIWSMLRRALAPLALPAAERSEQTRARFRTIIVTPPLRARLAGRRIAQEGGLTDALMERIGDRLAAGMYAAAAIAAFDVAWREWATPSDSRFEDVLEEVFAVLEHGAYGSALPHQRARGLVHPEPPGLSAPDEN